MTELRFTPGQQAVIDGTVDAAAILKNKNRTEKTDWRIAQVKLIVRAKPTGFLFTNSYFEKRLGYKNPNGFFAFKNTNSFLRVFAITPKIGSQSFELDIINDAKTIAMIEPTYHKPETTKSETPLDLTKMTEGVGYKAVPDLSPQEATRSETFLDLAKQVAIEKLAREMTVGEVLDGAKQFNL